MKSDMRCMKQYWNKLCSSCRCLDRPVVRKRIDAEMGIFSDKTSSKPIVSMDINGEWCYKLSKVLKVMAVILLAAWLWCRFTRWLRRVF